MFYVRRKVWGQLLCIYFATTDAFEYLLLRTVEYLILERAQISQLLDTRCCRSWVGVHSK